MKWKIGKNNKKLVYVLFIITLILLLGTSSLSVPVKVMEETQIDTTSETISHEEKISEQTAKTSIETDLEDNKPMEEPKVIESNGTEIVESKSEEIKSEEESFQEIQTQQLKTEETKVEQVQNIVELDGSQLIDPVIFNTPNELEKSFGNSRLIDSITSVDKTASSTINGCRTYTITLDINGNPSQVPQDIVLIIDRSASMNEKVTKNAKKTKLDYAKESAKEFVHQISSSTNGIHRVALVTYNGPTDFNGSGNNEDADIIQSFTYSADDMNKAIDTIKASGGTNTQAGFNKAKYLLDKDGREGASRTAILLSDGIPSASSQVGAFYLPAWGDQQRSKAVYELYEPYSITVDGKRDNIYTFPNLYTHAISSYRAAETLFSNTKVFTIGIYEGLSEQNVRLASDILRLSANAGSYVTSDSTAIGDIYNKISDQLNRSAQSAQVVDVIGSNFNYVAGSATATYKDNNDVLHNVTLDNSNFRVANDVITWTPDDIYKNEKLTYIVQFEPEAEGGGYYATSKSAILNYIDGCDNDGLVSKTFPIPSVYVANKLGVSLTDVSIEMGTTVSLGAGGYPKKQNLMSSITGGEGKTYTYTWTKVGSTEIISNSKNPEVKPEMDTQYQLTLTDSKGCQAAATMWVKINKTASIEITKGVVNGNASDKNREFDIFIEGPDKSQYVVTLINGETDKITGLELGTYIIHEIVPMNFTVKNITGDGNYNVDTKIFTIQLSQENTTKTMTITNERINNGYFYDDVLLKNIFGKFICKTRK